MFPCFLLASSLQKKKIVPFLLLVLLIIVPNSLVFSKRDARAPCRTKGTEESSRNGVTFSESYHTRIQGIGRYLPPGRNAKSSMLSVSKTIKYSVLNITEQKINEEKASKVCHIEDKLRSVHLDDIMVENSNDLYHAFSCSLKRHGTVILRDICPSTVVTATKKILQPLVTTLKRKYDHMTDEFIENHGNLSSYHLPTSDSISISPLYSH